MSRKVFDPVWSSSRHVEFSHLATDGFSASFMYRRETKWSPSEICIPSDASVLSEWNGLPVRCLGVDPGVNTIFAAAELGSGSSGRMQRTTTRYSREKYVSAAFRRANGKRDRLENQRRMKEDHYRFLPSLKTTKMPKIWEYVDAFWQHRAAIMNFESDSSILKIRHRRRITRRKTLDLMVNHLCDPRCRRPHRKHESTPDYEWHYKLHAATARLLWKRKRRKKRKRKDHGGGGAASRPAVIVGYGKGKASKFFRDRLLKRQSANGESGMRMKVVRIDEYFTSQKCCRCLHPLSDLHRPKFDISTQQWRYPPYTVKVCHHEAPKHSATDEAAFHWVYWNRDTNASINILHLLLCQLYHPESFRPREFQREDTPLEELGPLMRDLLGGDDTLSGSFFRE